MNEPTANSSVPTVQCAIGNRRVGESDALENQVRICRAVTKQSKWTVLERVISHFGRLTE